ncbi:hypothetical protein ACFL6P_08255 [Candidatus Latescibacterota bacterium]
MKANYRKIFAAIVMILIIALFTGCSAHSNDLIKSGSVSVIKKNTPLVYFSWVNVYQDGDVLHISGNVKRRKFMPVPMGHVEIIVLSPIGTLLQKVSVYHSPRKIPGKKTSGSMFQIKMPVVLSKGSRIIFQYSPTAIPENNELYNLNESPTSSPVKTPRKNSGIWVTNSGSLLNIKEPVGL